MMRKVFACVRPVFCMMVCLVAFQRGGMSAAEKLTPEEADGILSVAFRYAQYDDYEKVVELIPPDLEAWRDTGRAYEAFFVWSGSNFKLGRYADSLDDIEKYLTLVPSDTDAVRRHAMLCFMFRRYDDVEKDAEVLLHFDSQNEAAYNLRGMSRLYAGNFEGAIEDFSNAILFTGLGSFPAHVYTNRAFTYVQAHEYGKAMDDCTAVLKVAPSNANAMHLRATLYVVEGQYRKAINDAAVLIGLLGDEDYRGYFLRGYAYYHAGEYKKAAEDFSSVIEMDRQFADGYVWRGCAYMCTRKNKSALKDLKQALRLSPNTYQCHEALGIFYLRQNEKDKARGYFERAIELSPERSQTSRDLLDTMDSMDAATVADMYPSFFIENWDIFDLKNYGRTKIVGM